MVSAHRAFLCVPDLFLQLLGARQRGERGLPGVVRRNHVRRRLQELLPARVGLDRRQRDIGCVRQRGVRLSEEC